MVEDLKTEELFCYLCSRVTVLAGEGVTPAKTAIHIPPHCQVAGCPSCHGAFTPSACKHPKHYTALPHTYTASAFALPCNRIDCHESRPHPEHGNER